MRISGNLMAHTANPGSQNLRISRALAGREWEPDLRLAPVPGDEHAVAIQPAVTLGGPRRLRIPFWTADDAGQSNSLMHLEAPETTVDVTASGLGGRVDGVALAAEEDYLIWAFADPDAASPAARFVGFGITTRPHVTAASTASGGALGATGSFNVGTNNGNRFTVGARVLIREGTAAGAAYNQGEITARAANTITVKLNASYGAASEANASLAGLSGLEILQTDRFEPRVQSSGERFGGYDFAYVGHIQTDASSNVRYFRRRGEPYVAAANYTVYQNTIAGPTTDDDTVCLARWAPFHTRSAWVMVNGASGSTRNFVGLSRDSTAPTTISTGIAADDERDQGFALLRPRDLTARVFHQAFDAASSLGRVFLFGWIEEEF